MIQDPRVKPEDDALGSGDDVFVSCSTSRSSFPWQRESHSIRIPGSSPRMTHLESVSNTRITFSSVIPVATGIYYRCHSRESGNLNPIRIPGSSPRMTHLVGLDPGVTHLGFVSSTRITFSSVIPVKTGI